MILVGNQRGGAGNLAAHLMNIEDNEHVHLHDIRGFVSEELRGALMESQAIAKGTRCKQHLYSLSLNPPKDENVPIDVFENAVERIEHKLGLTNQPRAIVFHEKSGADGETRRHAHAVWSRIDVDEMKAIPISYPKKKLRDISRELYLEQGWKMPQGFTNTREADPMNFTLEDWQRAKRTRQDPREIKAAFQDAWAISDSAVAFTAALKVRGFTLARGDKRPYVGVDMHGQAYAVPRMTGVKTKDVRARLGDESLLPDIETAKDQIAQEMLPKLSGLEDELRIKKQAQLAELKAQKAALVEKQRIERQTFLNDMQHRRAEENQIRQARFKTGLSAMWSRLRGEHKKIRLRNEAEAQKALQRDRKAQDELIFKQIAQRKELTATAHEQKQSYIKQRQELKQDKTQFEAMRKTRTPDKLLSQSKPVTPVQVKPAFEKVAQAPPQDREAYIQNRRAPQTQPEQGGSQIHTPKPRTPKPGL